MRKVLTELAKLPLTESGCRLWEGSLRDGEPWMWDLACEEQGFYVRGLTTSLPERGWRWVKKCGEELCVEPSHCELVREEE